ncbi:MAG: hypothetical protein KJO80_05810, partial [Gammaproteobacteria bacterium]|nr:hypothetical protein [Gammaproteobacteria bacterium]
RKPAVPSAPYASQVCGAFFYTGLYPGQSLFSLPSSRANPDIWPCHDYSNLWNIVPNKRSDWSMAVH